MTDQGFLKKCFGNGCLAGNGIDLRIIAMAEGHSEPGIKIGMQPVECWIFDEIDSVDKQRQVLIKGLSDGIPICKDVFWVQTLVDFKIKQILYTFLPDIIRDTALFKKLLIHACAGKDIENIGDDAERLDNPNQIDAGLNGFFRFPRGAINKIGTRHDTVMFNEVEGFFDLSGFYGLVQFPTNLFGTALDAETDLDATGFSHPSKEIGLDVVDACDGDPCDMKPSVDNFLTDGLNPLFFVCEGII